MAFVLLQLFLCQSDNFFADQCWYGNLDPVLTRSVAGRAIAIGQAIALAQGLSDPLPGTDLGFAEARASAVSRIAQHAPDCGSLPPGCSGARRDLALVEHASDRIDALVLLGIGSEDHLHHFGLGLVHFIIRGRALVFLHVPVTERSAGKHTDQTLLRAMALAAS